MSNKFYEVENDVESQQLCFVRTKIKTPRRAAELSNSPECELIMMKLLLEGSALEDDFADQSIHC